MTKFLWLIALICFGLIAVNCFGEEIPDNMWQIVMAEAVSEGELGMKAVCCVVRNRLAIGLPMGLSGARRRDLDAFCQRQGVRYQDIAKRVVKVVFVENCPDITFGATHFENLKVFGIPYWAKNMVITCKIKDHTFYR